MMSDASFYNDLLNGGADPINSINSGDNTPQHYPATPVKQPLRFQESYSSVFTFTSETPSESIRQIQRIANQAPDPSSIAKPEKPVLSRWGSSATLAPSPTPQAILASDLGDSAVSRVLRDSKQLQIQRWIQDIPTNATIEPSATVLKPLQPGKAIGPYPRMDDVLGNYNNRLQSECSQTDCLCHHERSASSVKCQGGAYYGAPPVGIPDCIYPPLTQPGFDQFPESESTLVESDNSPTPPTNRTTSAKPSPAGRMGTRSGASLSSALLRRIICDCGHMARNKSAYKRHLQTKTHQNPAHPCPRGCGEVYSRSDSANRHSKNCYPKAA